jgi:hypothetical protein
MGFRFRARHANLVAYLTSTNDRRGPAAEESTLLEFLSCLSNPDSLISAEQAAPGWRDQVATVASRASDRLEWSEQIFGQRAVTKRLSALKPLFNSFDLFALILTPAASRQATDAAREFYSEVGTSNGSVLALLPYDFESLDEVIDPFPAIAALAKAPIKPPVVTFWTTTGSACALGLQDAKKLFRRELLPILQREGDVRPKLDDVLELAELGRPAFRVLHISDLHFGKTGLMRATNYVKRHFRSVAGDVHRITMTGDLIDNPKPDWRAAFDDFREDLEDTCGHEAIVIPGNHDVRWFGNAIGPRIGRREDQIASLGWRHVHVDTSLRVIFLCFNSAEAGNLAKGRVTRDQRLNVDRELKIALRNDTEASSFTRIALVHHHPINYSSPPTAFYERFLRRFFDEERFVEFEGAEEFMR